MQLGFSSGAPRARATFPVGCERVSNPPRSWAPKLLPVAGGSGTVVSLGELVMILELGEHEEPWAAHAATARSVLSALSLARPGYQRSNIARSVPSRVRVRVCSSR